jgi:hypothetical protein
MKAENNENCEAQRRDVKSSDCHFSDFNMNLTGDSTHVEATTNNVTSTGSPDVSQLDLFIFLVC